MPRFTSTQAGNIASNMWAPSEVSGLSGLTGPMRRPLGHRGDGNQEEFAEVPVL